MTKPILITGASRGLGAALAETLAETHPIIAVGRTVGALEELDDRIKAAASGEATLAPMDITDAGAMQHLCRSIYDRWGGLSAWVHAAIHAPPLAPADHIDGKDWDKTCAINVTATATLIPLIRPLLGANGTAVFFEDANTQDKFFGAYGASKAAQMTLARAWQFETAASGLDILILSPAPMPTATRARFFPGEDRDTLTPTRTEAARFAPQIRATLPA